MANPSVCSLEKPTGVVYPCPAPNFLSLVTRQITLLLCCFQVKSKRAKATLITFNLCYIIWGKEYKQMLKIPQWTTSIRWYFLICHVSAWEPEGGSKDRKIVLTELRLQSVISDLLLILKKERNIHIFHEALVLLSFFFSFFWLRELRSSRMHYGYVVIGFLRRQR
jgi:hypothetical protein